MTDRQRAITSFTLSIVSFVLVFIPCIYFFAIITAIISIVFGVISYKTEKGYAVAGITISLISMLIFLIYMFVISAEFTKAFKNLN